MLVELGPGKQWVQIDLKDACEIFAMVVWHYHREGRVYRDVVIQVADDADFITNVRTLLNNDHDSSSGLGVGKDHEYFENCEGKLIDAKGAKARWMAFCAVSRVRRWMATSVLLAMTSSMKERSESSILPPAT